MTEKYTKNILNDFSTGKNFRAYRFFGAHPLSDGSYVFRVWAKKAKKVYVVGDFNNWEKTNEMKKISDIGVFEAVIDGINVYDNYKYLIVTSDGRELYKADPYAFHAETRPGTASKIFDISGYDWKDKAFIAKREKTDIYNQPMSIYELHLGSFKQSEQGGCLSYDQLAEQIIPYVKEMGYTHIELLPVMEHPYDKSWGYQITGYYAPTSRFGTPHEFMNFIDRCHKAGIGVILDWVPAHFPKDEMGLYEFDGGCLYEYDDPLKREHPDWGTRIFDYSKPEVISFLISNACYWFEMYHADGIRVDAVASMLYLDYGKQNGGYRLNQYGGNGNLEAEEFLKRLNIEIHSAFKGVVTIAEESTSWPLVTAPTFNGGLGFDFKWNMGFMNDSLDYMKTDPLFRRGVHSKLTFSLTYAFSENFILPLSHDEVVHGKYSLLNKMPGEYDEKFEGLKAYYGYMFAHPGKKLMFMGDEFGQFIEWNEERELDWFLLDYPKHRMISEYVKDLNHIYGTVKPFYELDTSWGGFSWINCDDGDNNVFSFNRYDNDGGEITVISNFSGIEIPDYKVGVERSGVYKLILSSSDEKYGGKHDAEPKLTSKKSESNGKKYSLSVTLAPLSTVIYYKPPKRKTADKAPDKAKPATKKTASAKPAAENPAPEKVSGKAAEKADIKAAASKKSGGTKKPAAKPNAGKKKK